MIDKKHVHIDVDIILTIVVQNVASRSRFKVVVDFSYCEECVLVQHPKVRQRLLNKIPIERSRKKITNR